MIGRAPFAPSAAFKCSSKRRPAARQKLDWRVESSVPQLDLRSHVALTSMIIGCAVRSYSFSADKLRFVGVDADGRRHIVDKHLSVLSNGDSHCIYTVD